MLLALKLFMLAMTVDIVDSTKPSPVVIISNGSPIQGTEQDTVTKKPVTAFYAIPFAEPPIGDLRFAKPVPKSPWKHVYNATSRPNACYQEIDTSFPNFQGAEMWNPNTNISEDCLYLNIWVPGIMDSTKNLTVMAWIYGGGFFSGSSALDVYDGSILATEENVIVVSWNYRVGSFGFLYVDSPDAAGNVGILDQLEALKWVHQNIRFFGGDPNEITLFGESAGAGSVSLHSLSLLSRPYFKRFILQSGAATNPWAVLPKDAALNNAKRLAENCKCNLRSGFDAKDLLSCLRHQPAQVLIDNDLPLEGFLKLNWAPIVDGYFLDKHPRILLKEARFKPGEALFGSNSEEANFFIISFLSDIFIKKDFFTKSEFILSNEQFEDSLVRLLPSNIRSNAAVVNAILFEYSDILQHGNALERQEALDKIMGDYTFVCNVVEYARRYAEAGNYVFYYYFTHRSNQQAWPNWMGALHGYEINFVFGEPLNEIKWRYSDEEKQLSRKFMRYWANFARTGDPNVNPDGTLTTLWPEYKQHQNYITLSTKSQEVLSGPRKRQCGFWLDYLPSRVNLTGYQGKVQQLQKPTPPCISLSSRSMFSVYIIAFSIMSLFL